MKKYLCLLSLLTYSLISNAQVFLDPSFSDDGKLYLDFSSMTNAVDVEVQNDGKYLILNSFEGSNEAGTAVVRLNENGSYDETFGEGGIQVITLPDEALAYGMKIVLQEDGKILVGLAATIGFSSYYGVARLLEDGSMDSEFGTGGAVLTGVNLDGIYGGMFGIALQPDAKIIVYGSSDDPFNCSIIMYRLLPNGDLDTDFGDGEYEYQHFTAYNDYCINIYFSDDKIYLVGHAMIPTGGMLDPAYGDICVARLNMDGSPDETFGINGAFTANLSDFGDDLTSLSINEDGSIVVAGTITDNVLDISDGISDFLLCKISQNGTLDESFGTSGYLRFDMNLSHDALAAMVRDDQGRLYLVGRTSAVGAYSNLGAIRLFEDGTIDTSYGEDGKITVDLFGSLDDILDATLVNNEKIVVAGISNVNGNVYGCVARICPEAIVQPGIAESSMPPLVVFPNPATTHIQLNVDNIQASHFRLFNSNGKLVALKTIIGNTIDTSEISPGIYQLRLYNTLSEMIGYASVTIVR